MGGSLLATPLKHMPTVLCSSTKRQSRASFVDGQEGRTMSSDHTPVTLQNVCPKGAGTIMNGSRGGFAEKFRAMGALAVKIPEEMSSQDAAPLLCAGVTVWSPIHRYVTAGAPLYGQQWVCTLCKAFEGPTPHGWCLCT